MRKFPCSIDSREITRQELLLLPPEKATALAAQWAGKRLLSGSVSEKDKQVPERLYLAWAVCDGLARGDSFAALFLGGRIDARKLPSAFFHCGLLTLLPFCKSIIHAWELSIPVAKKLAEADEESTRYYLANPFTEELDEAFRQALEKAHAMEKVQRYYSRHKMSFGHIEGN